MKTETTFESLKFKAARLPKGERGGICTLAAALLAGYVLLTLQGNVNLFALDFAVGLHPFEEQLGSSGDHYPLKGRRQGELRNGRVVDPASESTREEFEWSSVNHGDGHTDLIEHLSPILAGLVLSDLDAAFAVKEASEISVNSVHLGSDQILPKSVDTQNGQYRAKQEGFGLPGVCREWMGDPKGKVHSELPGNRKRAAEMTVLHGKIFYHEITACYNSALLQIARQIDPYKVGDLSFSALEYQGMPWYQDRQCPSGRIYTGNTRYVHFFYDPAVMFKWSEKRTWPDQLLDIRILSLRLAFVFRSRMFLGVTDGWVA